jgi:hypothetical protein
VRSLHIALDRLEAPGTRGTGGTTELVVTSLGPSWWSHLSGSDPRSTAQVEAVSSSIGCTRTRLAPKFHVEDLSMRTLARYLLSL